MGHDSANIKHVKLLDPEAENATIRLKKIMIEDASDWEVTRRSTRINQADVIITNESAEEDVVTIDEKVTVTFYQMKMFTSMFADYFSNFDVLYQSLSTKFNRNQVFRAGEGAGRSGSFFFFSHDNKFIIKTIPKDELTEVLRLLPSLKEHY